MFGKKKRMSRAEQIAEDSWANLVAAMDSAGGTAKTTAKAVRSRASDLAGDLAEEASAKLRETLKATLENINAVTDAACLAVREAAFASEKKIEDGLERALERLQQTLKIYYA